MKATMIAPAEADDFIDPQRTIILDEVGSISVSTKYHLREIHGISFSKEDTLRGVTAEARELRKHDPFVEKQLDALRTYAKTKMDYLASNLGATLSEVEFDSKTWQFHAFADKGDGSTGERLLVDVICTDEHRSVLGQSNLYRKTERKRRFLMRVYMVELEKRLRAEGIGDVKNKELNLALSKSGFDFEAAFAYALDHIYTPLKKIYIEVQGLFVKKRKTKSDLKMLEGMSDEVPLARLDERAKISRTIQTKIDALEQRISALKEEGLLMVRELRSKLEVQGVRLTTKQVRFCIQKNNWNTDNAFTELLLSHCH